jgi:uncharacterized protein (TIGR03083 family)
MTGRPVRDLTRAELDDLLGAWAVDALDDDDRVAVEAALTLHPDLAATARSLRESAGRLGPIDARPADALAGIVAAAVAVRPPGRDVNLADTGPTTTVEAYIDQVGALSGVLDRVPDDAWDLPVTAYPWSVRDLVAHLVAIEAYSASFLGLGSFDTGGLEADHLAMTEATIAEYRNRPVADVVREWRRLAERTAAHVADLDQDGLERLMPLHGIPFRVTTAIVARAFELWTHADDIRAAIGQPLDAPPPEVVHRMATESVSSLPLAALGLAAPPGPALAHIVLTGPGGGTWTLRVGGGSDLVAEPDVTLVTDVIDYCRVVSRRLDIDTLAMTTEGDTALAVKLLEASQFVAM